MFNLQTEPLIGGLLAELGSAAIIVIIGIFIETEGVSKKSVLANILGVFLMLVTSGIDLLMLPLLLFYLVFGIIVYRKRWNKAYWFFSSKTYGCLMFSIATLHAPNTQEYLSTFVQSSLTLESLTILIFVTISLVVALWFMLIPIAYVFGFIWKKRRKLKF